MRWDKLPQPASGGGGGSGTVTDITSLHPALVATPNPITGSGTLDLSNFVGDSGSGGDPGLVPGPNAGDAALWKFLSAAGVWANPTPMPPVTLSVVAGAVALDAETSRTFKLLLDANAVMDTPSNPVDGEEITLIVTQDGAFTLNFPAPDWRWPANIPPVITTGAGAIDLIKATYDVDIASWLGRFWQGYSVYSPPTGDPYFLDVVLLGHFDNNMTDFSASAHTLTGNSGAAPSAAEWKWDGYSLSLNGSTQTVTIPASADWDIGAAGDWTVELWLYLNSVSGTRSICGPWNGTAPGWILNLTSSDLQFYTKDSTGYTNMARNFAFSSNLNTWMHIAVVANGVNMYMFVDGTQIGTVGGNPTGMTVTGSPSFTIGNNGAGGQYLDGYIDDIRITKGVGRYTANFTPPAAPFPNSL